MRYIYIGSFVFLTSGVVAGTIDSYHLGTWSYDDEQIQLKYVFENQGKCQFEGYYKIGATGMGAYCRYNIQNQTITITEISDDAGNSQKLTQPYQLIYEPATDTFLLQEEGQEDIHLSRQKD